MNKKLFTFLILSVGSLALSACSSPKQESSNNSQSGSESNTESESGSESGSESEVDYGELHINDIYAWVGNTQPLSEFYPHFSKEELKEELTYTVTNDEGNVNPLTIDVSKQTIKANVAGEWTVNAKSEHFSAEFVVKAQEVDTAATYAQTSKFNSYLNTYRQKWTDYGTDKQTTVFIGDSYFDPGIFWTEFDANYGDKDMMALGVSSSVTEQWETMAEYIFQNKAPENIAIHCGTNNIYDTKELEAASIPAVQRMLYKIHSLYPETNIYYFGITQRAYESRSGIDFNTVTVTNSATKAFASERSWVTYLATEEEFNASMLKDQTHPKPEHYHIFVDALVAAGVTFKPNPYFYVVKDIERAVSDTVGTSAPIKFGGQVLRNEFVLECDLVIKEYGNNAHIAIQYSDGNRALLWDNVSSKNSFRMGGQVNGAHECNGTLIQAPVNSTIKFKLIASDNDYYIVINDVLLEVMTNITAYSGGVQFGSESIGMTFHDINVETKAHNATAYNAAIESLGEDYEKYSEKTSSLIFYPDQEAIIISDKIDDIELPANGNVGGTKTNIAYKGAYLSRNFALTGKLTMTAFGNNAHIHWCFNGDMGKRFLLWRNGDNFDVATFGYARGNVLYPYSQGAVYYFKIVVTDSRAYFYVGTALDNLALRAVGVDIAAPAENNPGFEVASENFGVTFSDMTAITKANDLSAWNDEMTAMSSVISTYTTTTVVNS